MRKKILIFGLFFIVSLFSVVGYLLVEESNFENVGCVISNQCDSLISIKKPNPSKKYFIYNGETQYYEIEHDQQYYNAYYEVNTSRKDAGSQNVSVVLNNGYIWEDGKTENLNFTFTINKANVEIDTTVQNSQDHENGFEVISNAKGNFKVEYLIGSKWTENVPQEIGSYTVRIKRFQDNNYNEFMQFIENGFKVTTQSLSKQKEDIKEKHIDVDFWVWILIALQFIGLLSFCLFLFMWFIIQRRSLKDFLKIFKLKDDKKNS